MSNITETAPSGSSPPAQSTTEQAKERVQETAQQVQQQVGQKAQEVRGQAGERVRQQLDERSTQTGEQLTSAAGSVRRVGEQLRMEGNDQHARVMDQLAERADRAGGYLTQANADQILRDAEDFARRRPWVVVLGGAALGFVAARFVKASSADRYQQSQFRGGSYGYDDGDGYGYGSRELPPSPARSAGVATYAEPLPDVPPAGMERSGGRGEL